MIMYNGFACLIGCVENETLSANWLDAGDYARRRGQWYHDEDDR
jgi:hypothetical protein